MNKSLLSILILLGVLFTNNVAGQNKYYQTEVFFPNKIKSLLVKKIGQDINYSSVIRLASRDKLQISFDDIHPNTLTYSYSITHCDANWEKSDLAPIEYIDGFRDGTIEDFAASLNTTTQYTNYRLLIPNEDVDLKVSGNYVVQIYPENEPDNVAVTVCFSVVDPKLSISGQVTGNTDIDTYATHQQLEFSVNSKSIDMKNYQNEITTIVKQNNRNDNIRKVKPLMIQDETLIYRNNQDLIFNAGSEYRRMEFLNSKSKGMRIAGVSYHRPYYHVDLFEDFPADNTYSYDQDQNGRYFIGCSKCVDPDTEADYYLVHFVLSMPPIKGGKFYLAGDFTNNNFNSNNLVEYNTENRRYEKTLLLKQGHYNYMYLFVPDGKIEGETVQAEGDFYQTENEYTIYVYYKPINTKYDQLIGVQTIRFDSNKK